MAFKLIPSRKDIERFIGRFIERGLKTARVDERVSELKRKLGLERPVAPTRSAAPQVVKAAAVEPVVVQAAPEPVVEAPAAPVAEVAKKAKKSATYEPVPPPRIDLRSEVEEAPVEVVAKPTPPSKKASRKPAKKPAAAKKAQAELAPAGDDPLEVVLSALDKHPQKAALLKAGKQKDQLLRSLIPLFIAQELEVEVSSGVASKFWAKHGVKFAAPNAAKVLREHAGYAKRTAKGPQISPAGVKYVEEALAK